MPSNSPDFFAILEVLASHDVSFILVGGLAAVVHGAPIVTTDVDIVHLRSDENVSRLEQALLELGAVFRYHPAQISPNKTHLLSEGHQLLSTAHGNLDVLGTIDSGRDFGHLIESTCSFELHGVTHTVLTLPELIAVKARAGRDKDRAVLPVLKNTLLLRGG